MADRLACEYCKYSGRRDNLKRHQKKCKVIKRLESNPGNYVELRKKCDARGKRIVELQQQLESKDEEIKRLKMSSAPNTLSLDAIAPCKKGGKYNKERIPSDVETIFDVPQNDIRKAIASYIQKKYLSPPCIRIPNKKKNTIEYVEEKNGNKEWVATTESLEDLIEDAIADGLYEVSVVQSWENRLGLVNPDSTYYQKWKREIKKIVPLVRAMIIESSRSKERDS